jgi:uncharacterized membrane protein
LKTSSSYDEGEGNWQLKCVLDIRSIVCYKRREDGTLVLKYVVVGMLYGMWLVICFIAFLLVHFVG